MSDFKENEKLLKDFNASPQGFFARAFESMVDVYRFLDKKHGSNHCKIIDMLYIQKRKFTLERIATEVGLSDNALRRYRKEYVEWFMYYLELHQTKTATLLNEIAVNVYSETAATAENSDI